LGRCETECGQCAIVVVVVVVVRIFFEDIGPPPGPKKHEDFDCSINADTVYRQLTEIW
jgi:hypothetical protein